MLTTYSLMPRRPVDWSVQPRGHLNLFWSTPLGFLFVLGLMWLEYLFTSILQHCVLATCELSTNLWDNQWLTQLGDQVNLRYNRLNAAICHVRELLSGQFYNKPVTNPTRLEPIAVKIHIGLARFFRRNGFPFVVALQFLQVRARHRAMWWLGFTRLYRAIVERTRP